MIEKNDLYDYENMSIYQNKDYFKFSIDSVLLAEFVNKKYKNKKIMDLCSGNAVVPLILSYYQFDDLSGIEYQEEVYELAIKSIQENEKEIKMLNMDVNDIKSYFESESFDVITCNPPYFKNSDQSLKNDNLIKAIARHEIKVDLKSIIENSKYLLKNKGLLYIIHRAERIDEIILLCHKNNIYVKEMQFIYTSNEKDAELVIVAGVKNGGYSVKVHPSIKITGNQSYKNIFERK